MIYKNNNKHPDLSYNFYELKHVFQHGNGMSSFQACIHKIFRDVFLKMHLKEFQSTEKTLRRFDQNVSAFKSKRRSVSLKFPSVDAHLS